MDNFEALLAGAHAMVSTIRWSELTLLFLRSDFEFSPPVATHLLVNLLVECGIKSK